MDDKAREWREALKVRTMRFALDVVSVAESMPRSIAADVVARQLVRCATSTAANYRASCRGRSTAECIAKLGIAEEESDESAFWLEFALQKEYLKLETAIPLIEEANQITAMVVTSIVNLRKRL